MSEITLRPRERGTRGTTGYLLFKWYEEATGIDRYAEVTKGGVAIRLGMQESGALKVSPVPAPGRLVADFTVGWGFLMQAAFTARFPRLTHLVASIWYWRQPGRGRLSYKVALAYDDRRSAAKAG